MRPHPSSADTARRSVTVALSVMMTALGAAALVACSTGSGESGSSTPFSPRPTPPATASFSGTAASALASVEASARAKASAAASSASAAASSFEASVSAEVARANAEAAEQLKNVQGGGNARSDVSLTGRPTANTQGVQAVVVTIRNSTDQTASYAVQIDFTDSSGEVVESRVVGAQNLAPGEREQALAISRKPAGLTPTVAKAQRY
ncbi:FxLYD domain-containing protein [Streptomyces sp. NPDC059176]|uniref:FxLYD domain-containing protein n=1 Tax=unclassified Streptomyces TaxID=2593676 RepID=UPI00368DFCD2